jgi:ribosomal protein S18 acetylase RimI-like enzyme
VSAAVEVRPTIDRLWLERMASVEPLTHAYALWDLDRTPQAVRFVSAVQGEETVGYLLVWLGRGDRPVVHWFGPPSIAGALLAGLPAPPFIAVVPPEGEAVVQAAYPGAKRSTLRMMLREPGAPARTSGSVRRLGGLDRAELTELLRDRPEPELAGYVGLEPEAEPTWGAFERGRLVGVARAAVRLPRLWVVGGVYVEPAHRGRGLGTALVAAIVEAAERTGAVVGLYVRDEPSAATRLYEGLGFRAVGRRSWFEVGVRSGP